MNIEIEPAGPVAPTVRRSPALFTFPVGNEKRSALSVSDAAAGGHAPACVRSYES